MLSTIYFHYHIPLTAGYTDDTCQYIRSSVPKTMLADLKDSIKGGRSLNIQDKYGATAVSVISTLSSTPALCYSV